MASSTRHSRSLFPYYELYLSLRYLRSRFSSIAALLSVTFGVAVILIVLSIMGGYVDVLRETIRGQESHLMILGSSPFSVAHIAQLEETVATVENVKATAPFIETLAMYKIGQWNPCQLRGIQPRKESAVSGFGRYVLRPEELEQVLQLLDRDHDVEDSRSGMRSPLASLDSILKAPDRAELTETEIEQLFDPNFTTELLRKRNPLTLKALGGTMLPPIIVGIEFLLEHKMSLGQAVTIGTVKPQQANSSGEQVVDKRFVVVGAFRTGDYDFDSRSVFVDVDVLKNMLDLFDPRVNSFRYEGLRVALSDLSRIADTKARLESLLSSTAPWLQVITWEQLKGNALTAVVLEKFIIYFLLVLLMSFTGCMVLLMLLLTVIEKTRDMGVLLALGATPSGVVRIFLTNGCILVIAGTLVGLGLGYLFCYYINPIHDWIYANTGWRLFPPEIYHMDRIPITFRPGDVLLSVAPPLVLGFLSSLIPAVWASRRDPIKAIHYE